MQGGQIKTSPWCKRARIKMILTGVSTQDIVNRTGKTRSYITGILNGRSISKKGIKLISNLLDITDDYYDETNLDHILKIL